MSFNNNQNNNQPIGVFDSGVGGISVLKHMHALLPHEDLIYLADSKYAPYGNKTADEIIARCRYLTQLCLQKNVKAIVVACNTATAAAIDTLRAEYKVPFIGMEPAVKPAAAASKNGIIGVLATVGTLKSAQFAGLLEAYGRDVKVVTQAGTGLVESVERGILNGFEMANLLQTHLKPLLDAGADTIVLGCTHYPLLADAIRDIVGEKITLIDTGAAVAKQLQRQLSENNLLNLNDKTGEVKFWTNSEAENSQQVIMKLWGEVTKVKRF